MSSYIADISNLYTVTGTSTAVTHSSTTKSSNTSLDMTDFLQLMVAQLENQTIDDTADTSDMLNQLVSMQMIESLTSITEATTTLYAASLVGKEVTIGQYDSSGTLHEYTGTVTGTGYSDGSAIVFIGDQAHSLTDILAIGELPGSGSSSSLGNSVSSGSVSGTASSSASAVSAAGSDREDTALLEALDDEDDDDDDDEDIVEALTDVEKTLASAGDEITDAAQQDAIAATAETLEELEV
jgi:flagellar basal-body rod modification protein FlgD